MGASSGSVFDQSAMGMQQAGLGSMAGMYYQPQMLNTNYGAPMVNTQFGYSPQMVQAQSVRPQAGGAMAAGYSSVNAPKGYTPMMVSGQGYQAQELAGKDLSPYMNPYEQQVISNATRDLSQAQQINQNLAGAKASAAGAFGGSRQALMEAQTAKDYLQQVGDMSSALRNQGYQNAQQGALADLSAMNRASEFTAGQSQQANLANQAAQAQADQFRSQQKMQAALANQGLRGQLGQFDAGQQMQSRLANQQAGLQAALANQGASSQASQFGQQLGLNSTLANQQAAMQAQQMGLQAGMSNQQAGLSGAGQRLGAANQLANISNLGFGQGQQLNAGMAQVGQQQQALQQALINAASGQFNQFSQQPYQSFNILSQMGGMLPGLQSQNSSYSPGLFDYLSLGAGLGGAALMSDINLKTDIKQIGKTPKGLNVYKWAWNDKAKSIGADKYPTVGVIAQQVQKVIPDAVKRHDNGYLMVDYGMVG